MYIVGVCSIVKFKETAALKRNRNGWMDLDIFLVDVVIKQYY